MKSIIPKKVNYKITDKEIDGLVCIEVLEEEYKGTIFHFGKVGRIQEGDEEGLKFIYSIDEGDTSLEQDEAFKDLTASILYDLVLNQTEEEK